MIKKIMTFCSAIISIFSLSPFGATTTFKQGVDPMISFYINENKIIEMDKNVPDGECDEERPWR